MPAAGLIARTVRGLEWVAAEEVEAAGGEHLELAPRSVSFTLPAGDLRPGLGLRTVDDLFVRVGVVRGVGRAATTPAGLAGAVGRLDLGAAAATVASNRDEQPNDRSGAAQGLDVVVSLDGDRHFSRYDAEDAIGPVAAHALGATYHSRRDGAPPATGLSLRVAVHDDRAEVMLRLPARPLHRRGWKTATGAGTLHPPVAAALVRLAAPEGWVLDPCCGDGTIAVEAALARPGAVVVAGDLDAARLAHTAANAAAAGLGGAVRVVRADAGRPPWRPGSLGGATVVTNPPWKRAVGAAGLLSASLEPLWDGVAPAATVAVVADAALRPLDALTARRMVPVVAQQARVAGRVVELVVAGHQPEALARRLRHWRTRASAEGVTTADAF